MARRSWSRSWSARTTRGAARSATRGMALWRILTCTGAGAVLPSTRLRIRGSQRTAVVAFVGKCGPTVVIRVQSAVTPVPAHRARRRLLAPATAASCLSLAGVGSCRRPAVKFAGEEEQIDLEAPLCC